MQALETSYVVKIHTAYEIAAPQPAFFFQHPNYPAYPLPGAVANPLPLELALARCLAIAISLSSSDLASFISIVRSACVSCSTSSVPGSKMHRFHSFAVAVQATC